MTCFPSGALARIASALGVKQRLPSEYAMFHALKRCFIYEMNITYIGCSSSG
jgi:hypothetical protein